MSRWLLFVKWLFVIPAYIVLVLYSIAVFITTFISFWAILFTGRYPSGLFGFARGYMALQVRTYAYFPLLLTDQYPLTASASLDEQISYQVDKPEQLSRWLLFLKLVTYLLSVVGMLTAIAGLALLLLAIPAWFGILFIGRYPRKLFKLVVAIQQWAVRVTTWQWLMRDEWSLFSTTRQVGSLIGLGIVVISAWTISGVINPQSFKVDGSAMQPTLEDGQLFLANKLAYRFRSSQRGDVIAFKAPGQEHAFIMRVIGEPGETVQIRNGIVYIDDQPLTEPYIKALPSSAFGPVVVPAECYFVMGDNRNDSFDSRNWGAVPKDNIINQAWLIYWPFSAFGLVNNDSPELGAPQALEKEPGAARLAECNP